jgi:hypothetical protein
MDEVLEVLESIDARPPISLMGSGSGGRVYCDSRGRAYKVPKGPLPALWLEDEAAYLKVALTRPKLKPFLPKFYKLHHDLGIIEREFIYGDVATDADQRYLQPLFSLFNEESFRFGWSGPELSANAFVFRDGDQEHPILVDHGLAHRVGDLLVGHVHKRLARHPEREELWYLLDQVNDSIHHRTINPADGEHLRGRIEDALVDVP